MKMLARYKEAKELLKEKEKRERERKGVFKVGLYHQQASQLFCPLPPVSAATSRTKVRMSIEIKHTYMIQIKINTYTYIFHFILAYYRCNLCSPSTYVMLGCFALSQEFQCSI